MSADWSAIPVAVPYANLTNPQTLNLYAIVNDNPETFADLDGHTPGESRFNPYAVLQFYMGFLDQLIFSHPNLMPSNTEENEGSDQAQKQEPNKTITVGGKSVLYRFFAAIIGAGKGAVMEANPQNCANCRWAQTVTRTGAGAQDEHTDRTVAGQPLYPRGAPGDPENQLYDSPNSQEPGTFTAVSTLGVADTANKTFKALGAMTWGYSINNQGNVRTFGPRASTSAEQTQSINVLMRHSPDWTIGP